MLRLLLHAAANGLVANGNAFRDRSILASNRRLDCPLLQQSLRLLVDPARHVRDQALDLGDEHFGGRDRPGRGDVVELHEYEVTSKARVLAKEQSFAKASPARHGDMRPLTLGLVVPNDRPTMSSPT